MTVLHLLSPFVSLLEIIFLYPQILSKVWRLLTTTEKEEMIFLIITGSNHPVMFLQAGPRTGFLSSFLLIMYPVQTRKTTKDS